MILSGTHEETTGQNQEINQKKPRNHRHVVHHDSVHWIDIPVAKCRWWAAVGGIDLGPTDVPGKRRPEIDENPPNLTPNGLMVLAVVLRSRREVYL